MIMSYGPSLTERSLVTVILFFLDQRVHTGASYDQYGTELNFSSIIYWNFFLSYMNILIQ